MAKHYWLLWEMELPVCAFQTYLVHLHYTISSLECTVYCDLADQISLLYLYHFTLHPVGCSSRQLRL